MSSDIVADEPLGASVFRRDDALGFELLSRGDRVRGRLRAGEAPARPLVLVVGADGRCDGAFCRAVETALADVAAVASLDLPLCGARSSDKLSIAALDPGQPLAARLRPDLETQVAADLARTPAALAELPGVDASRVAVVATGLGAELSAAGIAPGLRGLALPRAVAGRVAAPCPVHVLPDADPPDTAALEALADYLRERFS